MAMKKSDGGNYGDKKIPNLLKEIVMMVMVMTILILMVSFLLPGDYVCSCTIPKPNYPENNI